MNKDLPIKLKIYLDTSVISALYDNRVQERQNETKQFWEKLGRYEVSTSDLTKEELYDTSDASQRETLLNTLNLIEVHPVTNDMHELARAYIAKEIFSETMDDDALHVAAAVLLRQDILLSWNFKHLVNRRRRAMVNQLNTSIGLPTIEIIAPPEI